MLNEIIKFMFDSFVFADSRFSSKECSTLTFFVY